MRLLVTSQSSSSPAARIRRLQGQMRWSLGVASHRGMSKGSEIGACIPVSIIYSFVTPRSLHSLMGKTGLAVVHLERGSGKDGPAAGPGMEQ